MSLNDPLDPETTEPLHDMPLPQPPPPPPAGAPPRARSLRAQFASVSPVVWLGLGLIGTLLIVIVIIATTTLVRYLYCWPNARPDTYPSRACFGTDACHGDTRSVC